MSRRQPARFCQTGFAPRSRGEIVARMAALLPAFLDSRRMAMGSRVFELAKAEYALEAWCQMLQVQPDEADERGKRESVIRERAAEATRASLQMATRTLEVEASVLCLESSQQDATSNEAWQSSEASSRPPCGVARAVNWRGFAHSRPPETVAQAISRKSIKRGDYRRARTPSALTMVRRSSVSFPSSRQHCMREMGVPPAKTELGRASTVLGNPAREMFRAPTAPQHHVTGNPSRSVAGQSHSGPQT